MISHCFLLYVIVANKGFLFRLDFNGFLSNVQLHSLKLTQKQHLNMNMRTPTNKTPDTSNVIMTPHKLIIKEQHT